MMTLQARESFSPINYPGRPLRAYPTDSPRNAAGELEWGGCDEAGDTVLVKMGWLGKKPVGSGSGVDTRWMTSDRPRFAVSVMGNLRDYVTPPAAGATP